MSIQALEVFQSTTIVYAEKEQNLETGIKKELALSFFIEQTDDNISPQCTVDICSVSICEPMYSIYPLLITVM